MFEKGDENHTSNKSSNMREKSDASTLMANTHSSTEQLHDEPQAEDNGRGDIHYLAKETEWN